MNNSNPTIARTQSYNPFDSIMDVLREMQADLSELKANNTNHAIDESPLAPASREQAAGYLGVSKNTLDKIVNSGQLPSIRIGRQVRFKWVDIELYIERQKTERRVSI